MRGGLEEFFFLFLSPKSRIGDGKGDGWSCSEGLIQDRACRVFDKWQEEGA